MNTKENKTDVRERAASEIAETLNDIKTLAYLEQSLINSIANNENIVYREGVTAAYYLCNKLREAGDWLGALCPYDDFLAATAETPVHINAIAQIYASTIESIREYGMPADRSIVLSSAYYLYCDLLGIVSRIEESIDDLLDEILEDEEIVPGGEESGTDE